MAPLRIDTISLDVFKATLARYPIVAPSTLADLDTLRYETVPVKLSSMKKEKHLLKADVEKLVEWKLKHGTFRPSLMNLVRSNTADTVKSITKSAFGSLVSDADIMKALKILIQLRGIGPATASLLLSVCQPEAVPFFSDELFRWTHWGDVGSGKGWERKIKYNVSEYKEVVERVEGLRTRLGVGATEAEKVAYVLGKEGLDIDRDGGAGDGIGTEGEQKVGLDSEEQMGKQTAKAEASVRVGSKQTKEDALEGEEMKDSKDAVTEAIKASSSQLPEGLKKEGMKRKAQEQKAPIEGTRRSTRRKT